MTPDLRASYRWWEHAVPSRADLPKDPETGEPAQAPLGFRGSLVAEPPEVDIGGKGKGKKKKKQVPATREPPRPFPDPTLGTDVPSAQRIAELLADPGLLDGRRGVALSALLVEAVLSDGITTSDMRMAKILQTHTQLVLAAHKQAATQAILAKAAVPSFERFGAILADVIQRFVPPSHRDVALNEVRMRMREALESAAAEIVKEGGKVPDGGGMP